MEERIMPKDAYTRAIEKQIKEQNRLADKHAKEQRRAAEAAARRDRAKAIIDGQQTISGFKIMDKDSEELLKVILDHYIENEEHSVSLDYDDIPAHIQHSMAFELEKLKMYGVLSHYLNYMSGCSVNISYSGLEYFENKRTAEEKEKSSMSSIKSPRKQYDLFISHASADKLSYVDDLYTALSRLKIDIFYDKEELSWGDNWKDRIIEGTEKSEFAIIIISESFFGREWTERELNEFLQRQNASGQKIILPLLYNITFEDVKLHYPELEFIQSLKVCDHTNDEITLLFARELIKRYKG